MVPRCEFELNQIGPTDNLPVGVDTFYSVPHFLFLWLHGGAAGVGTGYVGCAVCLSIEWSGCGWLVRLT